MQAPPTLPSTIEPDAPEERHKKELLQGYGQQTNTLRNWLGTYAAGMFGFLALNDARWKALIDSQQIVVLGSLILVGLTSQLLAIFVYKMSNATGWLAAEYPESRKGIRYECFKWITSSIWFDVITDVVTIVTFLISTVLILGIVHP